MSIRGDSARIVRTSSLDRLAFHNASWNPQLGNTTYLVGTDHGDEASGEELGLLRLKSVDSGLWVDLGLVFLGRHLG